MEIGYCVHSMNLIAPFLVGLIAIEMCPMTGKGNHGEQKTMGVYSAKLYLLLSLATILQFVVDISATLPPFRAVGISHHLVKACV